MDFALSNHSKLSSPHQNFGRPRARIVVRGLHKSIGPGRAYRQDLARSRIGHFPLTRQEIARLANRSDDIGEDSWAVRSHNRYDLVMRLVKRGANQVVHRRVDDDELFLAAPLAVKDRREQNARRAHDRAARFEHQLEVLAAQSLGEPVEVARGVLGEDLFAHDVAIRQPLPTGRKDWTRLGGYLHADWHHFTVTPFLGGKHYPMAVQSAWCISEFTRENGATLIWPGSHLSLEVPPEQPETLPPGYLYTEAPAGSVILWDSALWHTSGTNCGSGPRYSLVFYFHRWWLKGFNDSYRLVPEQARAAMTPEERRLWGLEAAVPPNTHFRGMSAQQIAALTAEEKAVLNIAAF